MEDLIGKKFGRLTIKDIICKKKFNRNRKFAVCVCDCGNEHITRLDGILENRTFSCGCQKNEKNKLKNYRNGMSKTRIHYIYHSMKARCLNKKNCSFNNYGERGITICDEWNARKGFDNFYDWAMKNGYKENLTIDRIDNNKGYSPENCRWVDIKTQSRNRRTNHIVEYKGVKHCLVEWAEIFKVNYGTLNSGLHRGKTIDYYAERKRTVF